VTCDVLLVVCKALQACLRRLSLSEPFQRARRMRDAIHTRNVSHTLTFCQVHARQCSH